MSRQSSMAKSTLNAVGGSSTGKYLAATLSNVAAQRARTTAQLCDALDNMEAMLLQNSRAYDLSYCIAKYRMIAPDSPPLSSPSWMPGVTPEEESKCVWKNVQCGLASLP
eukprot:4913316-Amphidinium_carterae.1